MPLMAFSDLEMTVKCCAIILAACNITFTILGAICVFVGIWLKLNSSTLMMTLGYVASRLYSKDLFDIPTFLTYSSILVISTGAVVIVIALLGLCGALLRRTRFLYAYAVIVLAVLLLQTEREPPPVLQRVCYHTIEDVKKDIKKLPKAWVILQSQEDTISLGILQNFVVYLQVAVLSDLSTRVTVLGIPASHFNVSMESQRLSAYLKQLSDKHLCSGVTASNLQKYSGLPSDSTTEKHFLHVVYQHKPESGICSSTCVRSKECLLLTDSNNICKQCMVTEEQLALMHERAEKRQNLPLNPYDSLRSLSVEKLKAELKQSRKTAKKFKNELESFKRRLNEEAVVVHENLHKSMRKIMEECTPTDELAKLFWEQQIKAFESKEFGIRWHPMMIRLALLLHSKSPAAYNLLRETGVLKLPGKSTLRDYTNYIHPKTGFQADVLLELKSAADKLDNHERYVALLHDEMAIKEDLVFDQKRGEIIGFININNWQESPKCVTIANHILVFYVVGINSSLNASMGFFPTRSAKVDELYPIFWEAIGFLERTCKLKVISSTSDKAAHNQRLYQLHSDSNEVCHKSVNMFARDRYIYFFSDVPHLIKTVRNNLFRSGYGKPSLLWKDGKELLWKHIALVYHADKVSQLSRTKLTNEHINLTAHSMMSVNLGAQVLSRSVGLVLQNYLKDDCSETARFILLMDRFFDCLNTRSLDEATLKRKPDLAPYTDNNDPRFTFLDEFVAYLENWKQSVETRPGNFTCAQRNKMFLSHQTFKGLLMTIRAFKEASHYLLSTGVMFVLSNKFCQDPLEAHFGRHRSLNQRSENPNIHTFGYQENKIRLQRTLAMVIQPKGNVEKNKRKGKVVISDSPLKKAKKQ